MNRYVKILTLKYIINAYAFYINFYVCLNMFNPYLLASDLHQIKRHAATKAPVLVIMGAVYCPFYGAVMKVI